MNRHTKITLASAMLHSMQVSQAVKNYRLAGMIKTDANRSVLPGRNDVCPCKSGRKFKQCCLPGVQELRKRRETKAVTEELKRQQDAILNEANRS